MKRYLNRVISNTTKNGKTVDFSRRDAADDCWLMKGMSLADQRSGRRRRRMVGDFRNLITWRICLFDGMCCSNFGYDGFTNYKNYFLSISLSCLLISSALVSSILLATLLKRTEQSDVDDDVIPSTAAMNADRREHESVDDGPLLPLHSSA